MITRARAYAQSIIDKGYNVVPLFPNSKETDHKNWQNRKYKVDDFLKDSNIGINLGLSGLIDVDLDCDASIHFGNKYLPHDTLMLKRIRPNGKYKISQMKVILEFLKVIENNILNNKVSEIDHNLNFREHGQGGLLDIIYKDILSIFKKKYEI